MSTPLLGSVHTIRVSSRYVRSQLKAARREQAIHALLFLEAILLAYPRLQENPVRFVFGLDYDARFLRASFDLQRGRSQYIIRASVSPEVLLTGTKAAVQKPVPRSYQSLLRSSYTLTRRRSVD